MRNRKMLVYSRSEAKASLASFVLRSVEHIQPRVCLDAVEAESLLGGGGFDGLLALPTEDGFERDLKLISAASTVLGLGIVVARRAWAHEFATAWPSNVVCCASNMAAIRPALRFQRNRGPKPRHANVKENRMNHRERRTFEPGSIREALQHNLVDGLRALADAIDRGELDARLTGVSTHGWSVDCRANVVVTLTLSAESEIGALSIELPAPPPSLAMQPGDGGQQP